MIFILLDADELLAVFFCALGVLSLSLPRGVKLTCVFGVYITARDGRARLAPDM